MGLLLDFGIGAADFYYSPVELPSYMPGILDVVEPFSPTGAVGPYVAIASLRSIIDRREVLGGNDVIHFSYRQSHIYTLSQAQKSPDRYPYRG